MGAGSMFFLPAVRGWFWWQVPLLLATGVSRGLFRVAGSAEAFEGVGSADEQHGFTAAVLHGGLDLGKLSGPEQTDRALTAKEWPDSGGALHNRWCPCELESTGSGAPAGRLRRAGSGHEHGHGLSGLRRVARRGHLPGFPRDGSDDVIAENNTAAWASGSEGGVLRTEDGARR